MSAPTSAIELRGLQVRYGDRMVLHNIDLTVERGEFVTIVGRSGCGKSTRGRITPKVMHDRVELDLPLTLSPSAS